MITRKGPWRGKARSCLVLAALPLMATAALPAEPASGARRLECHLHYTLGGPPRHRREIWVIRLAPDGSWTNETTKFTGRYAADGDTDVLMAENDRARRASLTIDRLTGRLELRLRAGLVDDAATGTCTPPP
jgi:hypothetical protein